MQNGKGWTDTRLSMVGGGGGLAPPPPRKKIKNSVRGNFNLFHLCFTNEIRGVGQSIHYTCKMKEGWRTGACPWWEGVGGLCRTRK